MTTDPLLNVALWGAATKAHPPARTNYTGGPRDENFRDLRVLSRPPAGTQVVITGLSNENTPGIGYFSLQRKSDNTIILDGASKARIVLYAKQQGWPLLDRSDIPRKYARAGQTPIPGMRKSADILDVALWGEVEAKGALTKLANRVRNASGRISRGLFPSGSVSVNEKSKLVKSGFREFAAGSSDYQKQYPVKSGGKVIIILKNQGDQDAPSWKYSVHYESAPGKSRFIVGGEGLPLASAINAAETSAVKLVSSPSSGKSADILDVALWEGKAQIT